MPSKIHAGYGEKVRQAEERIAAKIPATVWQAPRYTSASGAAPGV
jgi:hypothetical protein